MPAKMLSLNPGLRDITHSITGGAIAAQGYWMPYECAKAVCATFCDHIAGALIPIFGPDFPMRCIPSHADDHGRMAIDPEVVAASTREAASFRNQYRDAVYSQHTKVDFTASSATLPSPASLPSPVNYSRHRHAQAHHYPTDNWAQNRLCLDAEKPDGLRSGTKRAHMDEEDWRDRHQRYQIGVTPMQTPTSSPRSQDRLPQGVHGYQGFSDERKPYYGDRSLDDDEAISPRTVVSHRYPIRRSSRRDSYIDKVVSPPQASLHSCGAPIIEHTGVHNTLNTASRSPPALVRFHHEADRMTHHPHPKSREAQFQASNHEDDIHLRPWSPYFTGRHPPPKTSAPPGLLPPLRTEQAHTGQDMFPSPRRRHALPDARPVVELHIGDERTAAEVAALALTTLKGSSKWEEDKARPVSWEGMYSVWRGRDREREREELEREENDNHGYGAARQHSLVHRHKRVRTRSL